MKYQLIVFIWVLIVFVGCKNSMEKRVARQADDCKDGNCKVKIADFTDFQWDKMYVFNYAISDEEVDNAVGLNYSNYEEFTRPWIFVKDGRIVYAENNPDGIESIIDGQVVFNGPDSLRFFVYTPKIAVFHVKKKSSSNKNYY